MSVQTIRKDKLEYLTADGISVPHCFTTRHGGVSTGIYESLNLAVGQDDSLENVEKNLRILGSALGFDPEKLVMTRQIHSDTVRAVTEADHNGFCHRDYPECDGLVTDTPGVALMIFTADCTPILFFDPVTGAVGAAHAGWKGTACNIGGRVIETMVSRFGCRAEDIRCAIGPNIARCHFETDRDVPEAMIAAYGQEAAAFVEKRGEKYHVDLKGINALALRKAGAVHIEISDACTWCESDRFWSHRVTKGKRGSQGAIIVCREVEK